MKNRIVLTGLVCIALLVFSTCDPVTYNTFCSISGTVVEEGTNNPIQGVTVTVQPGQRNEVTGSDGTFTFLDLDPGKLTVWAQRQSDYESNNVTVVVNAGETEMVTITLKPKR